MSLIGKTKRAASAGVISGILVLGTERKTDQVTRPTSVSAAIHTPSESSRQTTVSLKEKTPARTAIQHDTTRGAGQSKEAATDEDNASGLLSSMEETRLRELIQKIYRAVSYNEGFDFTKVAWNKGLIGVTCGMLAFNQFEGNLPELLAAFHAADRRIFRGFFGRHSKALLDENYVKVAKFTPTNDLGMGLQAALRHQRYQEVQLEWAAKLAWQAILLAESHGFRSHAAAAIIADLWNQQGSEKTLLILETADWRAFPSEQQAIQHLADVSSDRERGWERTQYLLEAFSSEPVGN